MYFCTQTERLKYHIRSALKYVFAELNEYESLKSQQFHRVPKINNSAITLINNKGIQPASPTSYTSESFTISTTAKTFTCSDYVDKAIFIHLVAVLLQEQIAYEGLKPLVPIKQFVSRRRLEDSFSFKIGQKTSTHSATVKRAYTIHRCRPKFQSQLQYMCHLKGRSDLNMRLSV